MINYGTKKYLIDEGFQEIRPWYEYKHDNGLHICFDDHEWSIEDENDDWTETGSLNDTYGLEQIIDDYKVH